MGFEASNLRTHQRSHNRGRRPQQQLVKSTASSSPTGMSSTALCSLRAKLYSLNTLSHVDVLFFVFLFWFPSIVVFKSFYILAGSLPAIRPRNLVK